jgi:hypothetical protein
MGIGRNAFNMGRNAVIFLHPTLRNLTVSCFDIGEDVEAYLLANQNPTLLQSLTFDECNIAVTGLAAILSVPKALEKLTLGERMYHLNENPHAALGRSPALFLEALALQKDSLKYLKHIGGRTDRPGSHTDLPVVTFPNMREMELETHSILTLILGESASPRAPTIPPNLHLRLIRSYMSEPASDEAELAPLPSILKWLSRVPQLDYVLDCEGRQDIHSILTDLYKGETNLQIWKKIYAVMGSSIGQTQNTTSKGRLRILIMKRSGFIPPYMYGERRPEERAVFDSDSQMVQKRILNVDGLSRDLRVGTPLLIGGSPISLSRV